MRKTCVKERRLQCFTYRDLNYAFVLYGFGFSLFCFRLRVQAVQAEHPSAHFCAYLCHHFYLSKLSPPYCQAGLLIRFAFFVVLTFRFCKNVLIIFDIARSIPLALRIVHSVYHMICFLFCQSRSPQTVVYPRSVSCIKKCISSKINFFSCISHSY